MSGYKPDIVRDCWGSLFIIYIQNIFFIWVTFGNLRILYEKEIQYVGRYLFMYVWNVPTMQPLCTLVINTLNDYLERVILWEDRL